MMLTFHAQWARLVFRVPKSRKDLRIAQEECVKNAFLAACILEKAQKLWKTA